MALQLEILSPQKNIMTGQVDEVVVPSVNGSVGILPQHTQYLSLLAPGRVVYRQGGQTQECDITGGVVSVDHDRVILLID